MTAHAGGRGPRRPPTRNRTYVLRHRVRCGLCGRFMQGAVSGGRTYYRCKFASEYAVATKLGHPRSVNLREDELLPRIDAWLAEVFGEEHIDDTCEAMAAAADVEATIETTAIRA